MNQSVKFDISGMTFLKVLAVFDLYIAIIKTLSILLLASYCNGNRLRLSTSNEQVELEGASALVRSTTNDPVFAADTSRAAARFTPLVVKAVAKSVYSGLSLIKIVTGFVQ